MNDKKTYISRKLQRLKEKIKEVEGWECLKWRWVQSPTKHEWKRELNSKEEETKDA